MTSASIGEINILFLTSTGSVRERRVLDTTHPVFSGKMREFERLGESVAGIGDHNGDGIPDLATGIDNHEGGRVLLLTLARDGSPLGSHEISSTTTPALAGIVRSGDYFGWSIADLGDIDGNGTRDLAVGAWGDDAGPTQRNSGAIYVLELASESVVESVVKIDGKNPHLADILFNETRLGKAIAYLGDLDRDGSLDLISGLDRDDDTPNGWAEGAAMVAFGDEQIPTSVRSPIESRHLTLSAPAPNPFSSTTSVTLSLRAPQHLRITLVDPLGREVSTVLDAYRGAGEFSIEVQAPATGAGLYLLRLQGESVDETRPLTVVR